MVRAYCHSCAGRNRDYIVRANASHARTIADFILWGLIVQLQHTKGTQWTPTFVGVTLLCGWVLIFAYIDESNFLDPIPACAGMTSF